MAKIKKMASVAKNGSRLEQLKNLARVLAQTIDDASSDPVDGHKQVAQLAKQYRETIKEIEDIEGVKEDDDDIGEIIAKRKAEGKPTAIRKSTS